MNLPATLQAGQSGIEVRLRRNSRARRMILRVSNVTREATLTVPRGVFAPEALQFVNSQEAWLQQQITKLMPVEIVEPGCALPIEGRMTRIVRGQGRIRREGDQLLLGGKVETTGTRLKAFLKHLARDRLLHETDFYADRICRKYGRISLRDTRSRWGSCTSKGDLMYSWRLIMAPPEVLSYVAAHEVSHLVELNHSTKFWDQVARLMPEYRHARDWLRTHGAELHRYQF